MVVVSKKGGMMMEKTESKESVRFAEFYEKGGFDRTRKNMYGGRAVNPCGRECEEFGYEILKFFDHKSFVNFKKLRNNMDFLIAGALLTPNPQDCQNYFYIFIDDNLKRNKAFRMEFLKSIYLNENVFTPESIMWFVEEFGFEKENKKLLKDLEFKKRFALRLNEHFEYPQYHYDGRNGKDLKQYKILKNEIKNLNERRDQGIVNILNLFEKDKIDEDSLKLENFDYSFNTI